MEAITTLSGALTVLAVGFVNLKWEKFGNVAVTLVALIGGGLLIWMSQTDTIWVAYAGYVLFRMSYQMMMTVSSFEIAKTLKGDSTGLIFGVNTWAALGLQTILTVTVADAAGLALTIRNQFVQLICKVSLLNCVWILAPHGIFVGSAQAWRNRVIPRQTRLCESFL